MNQNLRFQHDGQEDIPRELVELGRCIAELPEEHFQRIERQYVQVVDCVRRRRRILNLVQEALAQLRLDIKYLMFDLDVTRQERDALQQQLEQSDGDGFSSY